MANPSFLDNLRRLPEDVMRMTGIRKPKETPQLSERLPSLFARHETVASPDHPDRNEDANFIDCERGLVALSDGAGGQNAGDAASRAAMEGVHEATRTIDAMLKRERERIGSMYVSAENVSAVLDEAVRVIAKKVRKVSDQYAAAGRKNEDRCYATLMLAKIVETGPGEWSAVVKGIGDSKALIRRADGKIEQVQITDDSALELWKKDGFSYRDRVSGKETILPLSEDEADIIEQANGSDDIRNLWQVIVDAGGVSNTSEDWRRVSHIHSMYKKKRNVVSRMLGMPGENPSAHTAIVKMNAGDRLYLLSDGVTDNLTFREMQQIANKVGDGNETEGWVRASQDRMMDKTERSKKDDATIVEFGIPKRLTHEDRVLNAKANDEEKMGRIRNKLGIQ